MSNGTVPNVARWANVEPGSTLKINVTGPSDQFEVSGRLEEGPGPPVGHDQLCPGPFNLTLEGNTNNTFLLDVAFLSEELIELTIKAQVKKAGVVYGDPWEYTMTGKRDETKSAILMFWTR